MANTRFAGKLDKAFDQFLTFVVFRVGFSCEDKLNRMFLGINNCLKAFRIFQQKIGPLVSRKATGKSDGQYILVQYRFSILHHCFGGITAPVLLYHQCSAITDETASTHFAGTPQFLIINIVDTFGDFRIPHVHMPIWSEVAFKQQGILNGNPRGDMYSVSDMDNGNFIFRPAGPDMGPHASSHLAVQFADAVAVLRHPQSQNKHGKGGV